MGRGRPTIQWMNRAKCPVTAKAYTRAAQIVNTSHRPRDPPGLVPGPCPVQARSTVPPAEKPRCVREAQARLETEAGRLIRHSIPQGDAVPRSGMRRDHRAHCPTRATRPRSGHFRAAPRFPPTYSASNGPLLTSARVVLDAQSRTESPSWLHDSCKGQGTAALHAPQPKAQRPASG